MALFRGGVKIFGSDVRIGVPRDTSLDDIMLDPRFRKIEGGQVPNNVDLRTTKPALINQMLQYIAQAEGLARSNRFYVSFQLPRGGLSYQDLDFEGEDVGPDQDEAGDFRAIFAEHDGFATSDILTKIQSQNGRRVNAFCKSITMPNRTMKTEEIINGPGPVFHVVTDHTYDDLTATFYADKYLRERQYFELWQKAAFNDKTNNFNFYDNYVSDIDIFNLGQFANSAGGSEDPNARDDVTHGVKLYDCYPTSVGAPTLAYATTDSVLEFTVTFKYRMWQNYFINKTADITLGDGGFDKSVSDERDTRLQVSGGLLGSFTSLLPPALRGVANRAGRDVLNDLKRRIPVGDLTGGRVFPPFF